MSVTSTIRLPLFLLVLVGSGSDLLAQSFLLKTEPAGLDAAAHSNGVAVADYDLDGDLDVYLVNANQHDSAYPDTWSRLFRNNGDRTFSDVTSDAGVDASSIQGFPDKLMGNRFGAAWGDYDGDGDPDLFLTNVGPEILYRNNGDGTFTDVAAAMGVAGPADDEAENSSAVWWDYDADGDLDLYVSRWGGLSPSRMYENNDGRNFVDVTTASGLGQIGAPWTAAPLDVNRDGLLDLYAVNDFASNAIMVNTGNRTFVNETNARNLGNDGHGMGVTVEDFDNDGFFDIYLTNIFHQDTEWNPLYRNDGTGHFTDQSHELGVEHADWAWGTTFFDCDHDGDLDLYVANGFVNLPAYRNRMFVNRLIESGTPTFENTAPESGLDGTGEARGVVAFDYDNDGDMDLLVANIRSGTDTGDANLPYLYENVTASGNWLKVNLRGARKNVFGVGATLRVVTAEGTFWRHNDGVGFLGQSIVPVHVGVGQADRVDTLEVSWPGGEVEVFTNIQVNETVSIREGDGTAVAFESNTVPEGTAEFDITSIYPNPARGVVSARIVSPITGVVKVTVVNVTGQAVASTEFTGAVARHPTDVQIDVRGLPAGLYVIDLDGRSFRPFLKLP